MARVFNGSTDKIVWNASMSALASGASLAIAFWLWMDDVTAPGATDYVFSSKADPTTDNSAFFYPNSGGGNSTFGMTRVSGGLTYWSDTFTRPPSAEWHHYFFTFNRNAVGNPKIFLWLDGEPVTQTAATHTMAGNTNWVDSNWTFMPAIAGKMAELSMWGSAWRDPPEKAVPQSLYRGASGPAYLPAHDYLYAPLLGKDTSKEPNLRPVNADFSSTNDLTLTGTTVAAHPAGGGGLTSY